MTTCEQTRAHIFELELNLMVVMAHLKDREEERVAAGNARSDVIAKRLRICEVLLLSKAPVDEEKIDEQEEAA